MNKWRFHRIAQGLPYLGLIGLGLILQARCHAQPPEPEVKAPTDVTSSDELALNQSQLADKYANLEKLLLRMAEYDGGINPQRAELLKRVFSESKNRQVQRQFETLVELLEKEQLGRALGNQKELRADLDALLKLLMSENRSDRIKNEKARLREYIREIERLQRMQRSVQGRTEGGIRESDAAREQKDLSNRTRALSEEIDKNERPAESEDSGDTADSSDASDSSDATDTSDSPGKSGDKSDSADDKSDKSDPADSSDKSDSADKSDASDNKSGKSDASDKSDSSGKSAPSDSSNKSDSSAPQSGAPSDSSPSQGQQQEQFPGQQNLQKARQAMERAVEKLEQAQRDGAIQEQLEAAKELAEAKARLEEILRQLREEEIERTLAMLETRVKAMLDMEIRIHDDTVRLDQVASNRGDRSWEIESGKLSMDQRRVVQEADKALALLREEGSSSAFPETLAQARTDMEQVAIRLAQAKTGGVTQSIEEDIIAALEEMLEALKQAQNDQRQRQQQFPPNSQQAPGDIPLVDQIAELKMIKSLQMRINRRTDRYARLLDDESDEIGQATDAELVLALQDLADREARLHELTRDIVLGRNR